MNNDDFNMSMRKFLKQVGVTSQQQIENAVRGGLESGAITGDKVTVRMTLTIAETGLEHVVDGEIKLGSAR
jgi:alkyl sulfatase BDS1-like metallo-beta-lactamase superfamily hydrolase